MREGGVPKAEEENSSERLLSLKGHLSKTGISERKCKNGWDQQNCEASLNVKGNSLIMEIADSFGFVFFGEIVRCVLRWIFWLKLFLHSHHLFQMNHWCLIKFGLVCNLCFSGSHRFGTVKYCNEIWWNFSVFEMVTFAKYVSEIGHLG